MTGQPSLTQRLNLFLEGDVTAIQELLDEILPTLHEIASRELKREFVPAQLSRPFLRARESRHAPPLDRPGAQKAHAMAGKRTNSLIV